MPDEMLKVLMTLACGLWTIISIFMAASQKKICDKAKLLIKTHLTTQQAAGPNKQAHLRFQTPKPRHMWMKFIFKSHSIRFATDSVVGSRASEQISSRFGVLSRISILLSKLFVAAFEGCSWESIKRFMKSLFFERLQRIRLQKKLWTAVKLEMCFTKL